jgi:hypothetical protein
MLIVRFVAMVSLNHQAIFLTSAFAVSGCLGLTVDHSDECAPTRFASTV